MESALKSNRLFSPGAAVRMGNGIVSGAILAITLLLGAPCHALAANLLTDPGFESGIFNVGSNWNRVGENQIWDCGEAHSGSCSLASAQNSAGGQNVTFQFLDTVAGQQYDLSFFYKTNRNAFLAASGDFLVISGNVGSFATALSGSVTGQSNWQLLSGSFEATGPLSRVSFSGQGFGLNALNVDDVGISAVPEPESYVMWSMGIAILIAAMRRRRRRSEVG